MRVNAKKLKEILEDLGSDIDSFCEESSVCIGEVNGNPVVIKIYNNSTDKAEELLRDLKNFQKWKVINE